MYYYVHWLISTVAAQYVPGQCLPYVNIDGIYQLELYYVDSQKNKTSELFHNSFYCSDWV